MFRFAGEVCRDVCGDISDMPFLSLNLGAPDASASTGPGLFANSEFAVSALSSDEVKGPQLS